MSVIGSGLALLLATLMSAGTTAGASAVLPPCDETAVTTTAPVPAGSADTTVPVTTAPGTTVPLTTVPGTTAPGTTVPVAPSTTLLPGWVAFASPAGDYNLAFPGQPDAQTVDAPTSDGGVVQITINAAEAADGRAYLVSSGMIPVGGTYSLEGGRDGMVANVGGTTMCSNPITLQGWPGIEAAATVSSGGEPGTLIGRIFATDDSFYQLVVVGPGTFDLTDPDVAAFFASFSLTRSAP
jgi:hypothetical protein